MNIRIDNNPNANFFKLFLSFCVMLDEIYYFLCYVISIFRIDIIKGMVGIRPYKIMMVDFLILKPFNQMFRLSDIYHIILFSVKY